MVGKAKTKREALTSNEKLNVLEVWKRVWALLTPKERRDSGLFLVGIFLNSFIQIIGLATVLPVIGMVTRPEIISSNQYLASVFAYTSGLGIDTPNKFIALSAFGLIGAFAFKAIFSLTLKLLQTRFSLGIGHRLSGEMWSYHFSHSLERMRQKQSGRVLSEINSWPLNLANTFLVGNLTMVNNILVVAIIAIGLLAYEPIILLSIALLLVLGGVIIQYSTKSKLRQYSDLKLAVGPQTQTLINSAVRGFLEVITFRASNAIRNRYLAKTALLYRINSNMSVLSGAPAKLYEVLAITAVSGTIILSVWMGESSEAFFNLLVIITLSAYKVMPTMTAINGQIMKMRSNIHVLNVTESAIQEFQRLKATPADEYTARETSECVDIELNALSLSYRTLPEPIFEGLSYTFEAGKVNAIVGPSGSGKSTLVNSILGLHSTQSGSIKIRMNGPEKDAYDLYKEVQLDFWIRHIGYLSQKPFLFNSTVMDNLTMGVNQERVDETVVHELIERLELDDCLGNDPLDFELLEGGNNLSGGQQQRLAILRALRVYRPVLILDEATSALDGAKRDSVFSLLRERAELGCNVLLITHDMELASQCDTVLDLTKNHNAIA